MEEALTREEFPNGATGAAQPIWLADLVGELVREAEEALEAAKEGRARGPVTRLERLDQVLGHALEPGLHGVTGDPGAGKTAFGLQVASHCGVPALYVTAEEAPKVLLRKLIARATRTAMDDLKKAVPSKVRELAAGAVATVPSLLLLDALRGPASAAQIIQLAGILRERFAARHVLVVIDSWQVWSRGLREGAEYDVFQAGLTDLAGIAAALAAPVILLSHRNRQAARDKEGAAAMIAAKGTADFEHLCESVLHLSPKVDKGEMNPPDEREVTVHVAKNRHGPSNLSLPLYFTQSIQTFADRAGGGRW